MVGLTSKSQNIKTSKEYYIRPEQLFMGGRNEDIISHKERSEDNGI